MNVIRIADGLWRWTAPHPNWRNWPESPNEPEDVGCVYYEAADAVVLVDPLLPRGEEDDFLAHLDRDIERAALPVTILLTCAWHRRSAYELADRYGTVPWAHEAGHARLAAPAQSGSLPAGIETFVPGGDPEGQVAFFIRPHRALVVADLFMGEEGGLRLCPTPALQDRDAFDASLRSLLELEIERVLVSHGEPVLEDGRRRMAEALARANPN